MAFSVKIEICVQGILVKILLHWNGWTLVTSY